MAPTQERDHEHERRDGDDRADAEGPVEADYERVQRRASDDKRARIAEFQEVLAAAIADDLGVGPDDLRAQVAAASLTAAFEVLERQDRGLSKPPTNAEIVAAIDPVIAFVRAGLEALPERTRQPSYVTTSPIRVECG